MALEGAKEELGSVQEQLAQAHSEIETIKAVATVSENTKQEAIDQVRSQWQEEVASLQAIMKGNSTENNNNRSVAQNKLRMCISNTCLCRCCIHFSTCVPIETVCEYEVQYRQRLEQERAQWNQYRESVERELGELRRRLTEGQEEENLEDEMKKVGLCSSALRISLSEEKFFFDSYQKYFNTDHKPEPHCDDPVKRIFHFTL